MKEIAGKILNYIYNVKFKEDRIPTIEEIFKSSNQKSHQIEMALNYCKDNSYLKIQKNFGVDKNGIQNMSILEITPDGINIVTDKEKFKKNFGFGVNLGIVNFNWGVQEK
ncbi:MAG: hypothetical protein LAT82_03915 [Nanoarchaeota archaeon]|nr:hypothetical protein [Nanoarchaeota archaeon]